MFFIKSLCLLSFIFVFTIAYGGGVRIYDRGVNMEIASYQLPAGWKIDHHIVSDLHNNHRFYTTHKLDFHGSRGEVFSNAAPTRYSRYLGKPLGNVWHTAMTQRLNKFGKFQVGNITQSAYARYVFPELRNFPNNSFIESRVSGYRNGKAFEGICVGILADGHFSGQFVALIIIAPKGQFDQTLKTYQQIQASKRNNNSYLMRINQLNQQKNQRLYAQNQAFMRSQKQMFDANQKAINDLSRTYSRSQNAGRLVQGYSSNSNGAYSSQDGYNDYLKGTTSFDDDYMGYRMPVDGTYDYWFTDDLGHYYGTDNPGFSEANLGTNWRVAQPVR